MKLLVSALEPSSNLHLKELLKHTGNIDLVGIFSEELGTPIVEVSQNAVMGIIDVVKKVRWYKSLIQEMVELAKDVDKVLLMDSSGFNLPLAKKLKQAYPTLEINYYILPQIWASRKNRVKNLEKYCDHLLGILPFEVDYYSSKKARYIGHPLLDEITHSHKESSQTIAFMPGSRRAEIEKLLPVFKALRAKLAHKEALLIIPPDFTEEKIKNWYGDISTFTVSKNTHQSLANSEFAFICSGTATLEAALIGTPFTLAYIAKPIEYFIGIHLFKIKQIGLANIILNHASKTSLHKEFLQHEVSVDNLLNEYQNFDKVVYKHKIKELKSYLSHGSSQNVAKHLMEESC